MVTKGPVSVKIEDVHVSFGRTRVLTGVNLDIEPGEFFAFLGPSGSGKSTLLRAIAGFGPAPEGRILIGDQDITALPPWKRNVGMVFQSYALWPHMSVRKNVAFGLEERGEERKEIRRRVDAALELVGLSEFASRRPAQLSGGQQQRVALARTVVVEPRVLLLDEPLSNLDANLRVQMRRDILDLQRKLALTTIFVTHDQEEANTMSDRMAVLNDGVIQQVGTPMALYDRPANLFVADFLGTANVLKGNFTDADGGSRFKDDSGIEIPIDKAVGHEYGAVVFRPQNLTIQSPGAIHGSGIVRLSGTVRYVEFLGSIVRYAVDVGPHVILIDENHRQGDQVLQKDSAVEVGVDPSYVISLSQ
ncbi:MAG: ABC transporter ATP-binding protein [Candidatus Krumholzibacteria bacterium]|nr:ABC transporter ATP-binding protein [Candidatus Krumholzibacteria bacterium]